MRHPKPTPLQNAGRLIRKAADVLEDNKWVRGAIGTKQTGVCTQGAILLTLLGSTNPVQANNKRYNSYIAAESFFTKWLFDNGHSNRRSIPAWNDTEVVNKEEVVRLMRKFADEVDPQRV